MGCHALFQEIFLTQGSNLLSLLHRQVGSLPTRATWEAPSFLWPLRKPATPMLLPEGSAFHTEPGPSCTLEGPWLVRVDHSYQRDLCLTPNPPPSPAATRTECILKDRRIGTQLADSCRGSVFSP